MTITAVAKLGSVARDFHAPQSPLLPLQTHCLRAVAVASAHRRMARQIKRHLLTKYYFWTTTCSQNHFPRCQCWVPPPPAVHHHQNLGWMQRRLTLDYAALAQATETTPAMPESAVQVSATGVSSPRARPAAASSSPRSRSRNRKASSCSSVGDRGNGISGGKFWLAAANAAFAIDKPDPPYASSRVKAWPIPLRRPETVSTAAAPQGTHIPGTKSRTPTSAAQPKSPTSACPGPKPARAAVAVACSSPSSSCAARYGSRQSSRNQATTRHPSFCASCWEPKQSAGDHDLSVCMPTAYLATQASLAVVVALQPAIAANAADGE